MKIQIKYYIGIIAAIALLVLDFSILKDTKWFYFIMVISGIIAAIPFIVEVTLERGRQKEIDERFLEFSRDLVENVKSGTPISKSIVNLKTRNYGQLSFHIQKLANQVSIGIPLTEALTTFANGTNSPVIARSVNLISEAEKSGGQIETILESVANSINQTEQLKKERKSAVSNLIVQGYIIFIIFIVIMLILEFLILPMIPAGQDLQGLSMKVKAIDPGEFSMPLLVLLLVQSLFSGLVIGKISEGSIKDGIKHSFILIALTLLLKTGVSAIAG